MKSKRHEEILKLLSVSGTLTVEQVVEHFGASMATVRRDFNEMSDANLVRRIRGGIQIIRNDQMTPFAMREVQNRDAKLLIAQEAATMLAPGNVVFIDGGTTTLQLASCLPPIPLRIITNSLRLAAAMESQSPNRSSQELFLTGGFLFPSSGLLVGPSAQSGLSQYHANWAMLSVSGISESGLYNDNEHVVESERLMVANADRVVVLADHSKIGKHAMCHISDLTSIDVLITDGHPSSERSLQVFRDAGIEVLTVDTSALHTSDM